MSCLSDRETYRERERCGACDEAGLTLTTTTQTRVGGKETFFDITSRKPKGKTFCTFRIADPHREAALPRRSVHAEAETRARKNSEKTGFV